MKIYKGDKLVAASATNRYGSMITPLNGVTREELPHSLFGRGEYAVDEVEVTFALHRWVANRVPPRTRKDLDKIYDIDIREYSVELMTTLTNAREPKDDYWVEL